MTGFSFFAQLDDIPRTTAQQKGVQIINGHPHYFIKKKVREVEALYADILRIHKPAGLEPLEGPLRVRVFFYFPTKRPHKDGEPKTTRPDVENMVKVLLDQGTAVGYWLDDSQITDLRIVKTYGRPSGFYFEVEKITFRTPNKGGTEDARTN